MRPGYGFLDPNAIEILKTRAFDLLENYGIVIVHPRLPLKLCLKPVPNPVLTAGD